MPSCLLSIQNLLSIRNWVCLSSLSEDVGSIAILVTLLSVFFLLQVGIKESVSCADPAKSSCFYSDASFFYLEGVDFLCPVLKTKNKACLM